MLGWLCSLKRKSLILLDKGLFVGCDFWNLLNLVKDGVCSVCVCVCVCHYVTTCAQNHHHKLWRIRRSKVNAHCRLYPDFALQFSDVWWQGTAKWHQKPPLQPRHQWDVSKKLQSCIYIIYMNQISHVSGWIKIITITSTYDLMRPFRCYRRNNILTFDDQSISILYLVSSHQEMSINVPWATSDLRLLHGILHGALRVSVTCTKDVEGRLRWFLGDRAMWMRCVCWEVLLFFQCGWSIWYHLIWLQVRLQQMDINGYKLLMYVVCLTVLDDVTKCRRCFIVHARVTLTICRVITCLKNKQTLCIHQHQPIRHIPMIASWTALREVPVSIHHQPGSLSVLKRFHHDIVMVNIIQCADLCQAGGTLLPSARNADRTGFPDFFASWYSIFFIPIRSYVVLLYITYVIMLPYLVWILLQLNGVSSCNTCKILQVDMLKVHKAQECQNLYSDTFHPFRRANAVADVLGALDHCILWRVEWLLLFLLISMLSRVIPGYFLQQSVATCIDEL